MRSQNCSTRSLVCRKMTQQDSANFLSLEISVREIVRVNGDVSLCTPTANDIVGIHIASGRICAKSFRCLGVCTAGRSTLVLGKYANMIVISLQMCVFVCVHPLHGRDLATCTCELTRFSICQNNNRIATHLCFPYRTACFSGDV